MNNSNLPFSDESDESLLMLARRGNVSAHLALTKRYFDRKHILAKQASAPLASLFDSWDINHIFFTTFLHASDRYELGQMAKFSTYFLTCFRHELLAEAKANKIFERGMVLSLDAECSSDYSDGSFALSDVIAAPDENPMRYVDFFDECLENGNDEYQIDPQAVDVARLKIYGYSFRAIARLMNQSVRRCKNLYLLFLGMVKRLL